MKKKPMKKMGGGGKVKPVTTMKCGGKHKKDKKK